MRTVSVRELQREIRAILDRVERGESVQITRWGRPIARLVPAARTAPEPWPDLAARALRPALELEAVFGRADRLSETHASRTLARSLDILHVAALLELGCTALVSGDDRQLALARAEGIRTVDIHWRA